MSLSLASRVALNTGHKMPVLGLGVWQVSGAAATKAVTSALQAGYRLIDTAKLYGNEAEVGRAVRESGIDREEIFVTTKLWNDDHGRDRAPAALEASLRRLGLDYLDLYLIHWPGSTQRVETWKALTSLAAEGRCRSFGVSNFTPAHLEELLRKTDVVPAVNQVEQHPFLFQSQLDEYCSAHGIVLESYSPLARGEGHEDPTLVRIAQAHRRSVAQVMLRWGLQHGFVVIPKSVHAERIRENAAVFDFELEAAEMSALDGLNRGAHVAWDPSRVP